MPIYVCTQVHIYIVYVFYIYTYTVFIYTHITIIPSSMNIKYSLKRISVLFIYVHTKHREISHRDYGLQCNLLSKLALQ